MARQLSGSHPAEQRHTCVRPALFLHNEILCPGCEVLPRSSGGESVAAQPLRSSTCMMPHDFITVFFTDDPTLIASLWSCTGSWMPDAANTNHSRTGTEFPDPAAPRCRLMTAGTGLQRELLPLSKSNAASTTQHGGLVVGLSRQVMRNRFPRVATSAPPDTLHAFIASLLATVSVSLSSFTARTVPTLGLVRRLFSRCVSCQ